MSPAGSVLAEVQEKDELPEIQSCWGFRQVLRDEDKSGDSEEKSLGTNRWSDIAILKLFEAIFFNFYTSFLSFIRLRFALDCEPMKYFTILFRIALVAHFAYVIIFKR